MPETVTANKVSIVDLNALLKERKGIYEKANAFRDEREKDGKMSAEDHAEYMKMLADVEAMSEKADRLRTELQIQDSMAEATLREHETEDKDPDAKRYKSAWLNYVRMGMADIDPEDRKILQSHAADIRNALGIGSGAVGAYTVPEDFYGRVVEVLKAFGGMRGSGAEIITTGAGADLPVPTGDDTSNVGEIVNEGSATGSTSDPTFGQVVLKAYTYSSKILRVHLTLLQDEGVNLEALLSRWLGTRIARIQNTHFTTGNDTNQPDGVLNSATDSGVTLASATEIAYDELVDIMHSVDPAYRGPNSRFMFHDSTLAVLKKIKNATTGEPLWLPAVSAREPDRILGEPYTINQDFPTFSTAASKIIAYGDFSQYFIRDVRGGSMVRLVERYADYLQVGLMLFTRADGALVNTAAIKYATSHA